jgi:peptidyl-prolyl cis-trans isomerase D
VPDVSVWAFDARPGETGPVVDAERASYVFRLDSLEPAGIPPLAAVRARVRDAARREKKLAVARQHAEQVASELKNATDLAAAGRAKGLRVEKIGPFTRLNPTPELSRNPVALGAAFGLRAGEKSPLIAGETGFFLLQGIRRTAADSAAWVKQKAAQRETLIRPIEQARIQQYLAALRAQATIVDRRNEIFRPAAAASES